MTNEFRVKLIAYSPCQRKTKWKEWMSIESIVGLMNRINEGSDVFTKDKKGNLVRIEKIKVKWNKRRTK